jgi:uncharacterized heparinase superfamily protein
MTTLGRYYHTVRHLRPIQIAGRLRLALPRPRPDLRPAPPLRAPRASYAAPIAGEPSLLGPDRFRLLNEERRCLDAAAWHPRGASDLWTYHLHYFDDLNARDADARADWHRQLLSRWVAENPPPEGRGWDPYPVSRRIVNWVKWALRGQPLPRACHESLAVQARWLMRRLEHHLLGNHLLANAKALVHAGSYFEGPEAELWYGRGMRLLEREQREQILADGAHFELSPMYHALALEDVLDLINLRRSFGRGVPGHWPALAARMQTWLAAMSHPDGELAFFNDAAMGAAPAARALEEYAQRLGLPPAGPATAPLAVLGASGYVRAALGPACLICDCASVGPGYLPGHAHADTLSFELSLGPQRLFVNSGTSQYGSGAERQRQRGTRAHNTVTIDGLDSSEIWGGFRVARRARGTLRQASATAREVAIEGSHDGYRRLQGRNEHRRRWLLAPGSLRIADRITGRFTTAEARLFLHPQVEAEQAAGRVSLTLAARGLASVSFAGAASVTVERASWHPQFGVSVPSLCVTAKFAGATLETQVSWES